jgi:metal-responsive CopG/Arc/MetJ family transcriptional regulator
MRITLNLPDDLMNELIKTTGVKNKTHLIRTSLEEMLKKAKRDKLLELRGKIKLDLDLEGHRSKDMI